MTRRLRTALASLTLALGLACSGVGLAPAAAASAPTSLYLFHSAGFTWQDPNYYACTSTSVQDMLNFIALRGLGGEGFVWRVDNNAVTRDAILRWSRDNDTLQGGNGTDPHGWRNALNAWGWGRQAMWYGHRRYDDLAFGSYDYAMKAAVRAMAAHRKPVGLLAWAGKHAQMVVGYYGLVGDPFARDAAGRYTNNFSVAGFYLADPLRSQNLVNARVSWSTLKSTSNSKLRFRPYLEHDSPYDDPFMPGTRPSHDEWYGRYVIIAPVR